MSSDHTTSSIQGSTSVCPHPAPSSCSFVDPGVTTIPIILPHLLILFIQSHGSPQPQTHATGLHWGQGNGLFWDVQQYSCFEEWGAGGAAGSRKVGTGLSMAPCRTHAHLPGTEETSWDQGVSPGTTPPHCLQGSTFGRLPPPMLGLDPFGPQSWLLSLGWVAVPPRVWQGQGGCFSCPMLPPVPTACDLGAAHYETSHP